MTLINKNEWIANVVYLSNIVNTSSLQNAKQVCSFVKDKIEKTTSAHRQMKSAISVFFPRIKRFCVLFATSANASKSSLSRNKLTPFPVIDECVIAPIIENNHQLIVTKHLS